MAWNSLMDLPKAFRCFAYLTVSSRAPCAKAVLDRHNAIIQQNLHRGRRPLPHLVLMAPQAKPRKSRLDQKCGNALAACGGIGFRKDNQHARGASICHPGLRSVE